MMRGFTLSPANRAAIENDDKPFPEGKMNRLLRSAVAGSRIERTRVLSMVGCTRSLATTSSRAANPVTPKAHANTC
jgi:hypothetical protein